MGAYLAVPVTAKERFEGRGLVTVKRDDISVVYGGAAMQGWRRTMEDAHVADTGLRDAAVFGVFDGHGGAEVALFCQRYMAQELQKLESFGGDAVEDALVDVFHRMDDMLRDHTFADELEQLKTTREAEEDEGKGDDGVSPMDALEMIKRVFQLKRFMGENGQPADGDSDSAGAGAGVAADEAVAMEDDEEGPSGQEQQQEQQRRSQQQRQQQQPQDEGASSSSGTGSGGQPWQQQAAADEQQQLQRVLEPADARIQAGCTAVVAVIKGGHLYVANAGDSRGVLCRGGTALAMSEDHKPAQETERKRILNAGGPYVHGESAHGLTQVDMPAHAPCLHARMHGGLWTGHAPWVQLCCCCQPCRCQTALALELHHVCPWTQCVPILLEPTLKSRAWLQ